MHIHSPNHTPIADQDAWAIRALEFLCIDSSSSSAATTTTLSTAESAVHAAVLLIRRFLTTGKVHAARSCFDFVVRVGVVRREWIAAVVQPEEDEASGNQQRQEQQIRMSPRLERAVREFLSLRSLVGCLASFARWAELMAARPAGFIDPAASNAASGSGLSR